MWSSRSTGSHAEPMLGVTKTHCCQLLVKHTRMRLCTTVGVSFQATALRAAVAFPDGPVSKTGMGPDRLPGSRAASQDAASPAAHTGIVDAATPLQAELAKH